MKGIPWEVIMASCWLATAAAIAALKPGKCGGGCSISCPSNFKGSILIAKNNNK
jgi:hypothetical protein